MVVTERGVASFSGRSVRERALALIDIAHPDDREKLIEGAKRANILYRDQIYLADSFHTYPDALSHSHTFKGDLAVHFRAIKPSDEDAMRKLFYRFSSHAIYFRYLSHIRVMPHESMQDYVNIDYLNTMSLIGTVERKGVECILAEGRYIRIDDGDIADIAIIVDEEFQSKGIATHLLQKLIEIAAERGVKEFTGLLSVNNKSILEVFRKISYPIQLKSRRGLVELTMQLKRSD